jgi:hypothetical protein
MFRRVGGHMTPRQDQYKQQEANWQRPTHTIDFTLLFNHLNSIKKWIQEMVILADLVEGILCNDWRNIRYN